VSIAAMTRDVIAVMVTVDRSPGQNYLNSTLKSLANSDLLTSERLHSLTVLDSDCLGWSERVVESLYFGSGRVLTTSQPRRTVAKLNVASALTIGAELRNEVSGGWILFLEDDIAVCSNFFDSVATWLDKHSREDRRVYSFGANYQEVKEAVENGLESWDYPIDSFYGTQCFAIRPCDAVTLADELETTSDGPGIYDLTMHTWAKKYYPNINHFLASAPSFVQHMGEASVIRKEGKMFTFPSWPGEEWSYLCVKEI